MQNISTRFFLKKPKNMTKAKLIHLEPDVKKRLSIRAVHADKSLKKYIEHLLLIDSKKTAKNG